MTLFDCLLVGHLIGDFLLQNRWMAENKSTHFLPLLVHTAVYTAAVSLMALIAGGLSWQGITLIFLTHFLLDRRGIVAFWTRYITVSNSSPWLVTMIDQTWHVVVLVIAVFL
ncbi:MAG: DUF3307 domain-containing protein [Thermacetogeniaceae bacterium]